MLESLLQGMSNKDIADRMRLSANIVKTFLRCIKIKTCTSSRSMIVARLIMSTPAPRGCNSVVHEIKGLLPS